MTSKIESLKAKRDQITAQIQAAEARLRAGQKKQDDRVKVLVGAAVLEHVKQGGGMALTPTNLIALMQEFLQRPAERAAVLGDDGQGSEALRRLIGALRPHEVTCPACGDVGVTHTGLCEQCSQSPEHMPQPDC